MNYVKKTVVIKEVEKGFSISDKPVSGIARVEIENGVSGFFLSTINFKSVSDMKYFCFLIDSHNKLFEFDLGIKPLSFFKSLDATPSIDNGWAVGVTLLDGCEYTVVAFANADGLNFSLSDFRKVLDKKSQQLKKQVKKEIEKTPPKEECVYDDEAVATENYFDLDDSINQKLKTIEGKENERLLDENDLPNIKVEEETEKDQNCFDRFEDALLESPVGEYTEDSPYFLDAERELKEIFSKFPPEDSLLRAFPNSKWAKINYSKDKFYVVGLITENEKPKYICYGVPSEYSSTPPKELEDFCSFVPLPFLDKKGDGYWMMFQDAISGDCIKKN